MKAMVRGDASLIWRNLIAPRGIIDTGTRWRVEDGAYIKIWKDRWLPTPTTFSFSLLVNAVIT